MAETVSRNGGGANSRGRHHKLRLFLATDDARSFDVRELVQAYEPKVEVLYVDSRNGDVVFPWLATPLSSYHGLEEIRDFLEEGERTPVV